MNDRRLLELTIPAILIMDHCSDGRDRISKAVCNYVIRNLLIFCAGDKEKFGKLMRRSLRTIGRIKHRIADNNTVNGKKLVITAYFLSKISFDNHFGTEEVLKLASFTKKLIEFATRNLEKEVGAQDVDNIAGLLS